MEEEGAPTPGSELQASGSASSSLDVATAPQDQRAGAGWEMVVYGSLPEVRILQDGLLSSAHQAITRLGESLVAEQAVLEEEWWRLAATWYQAYAGQGSRAEEQVRAADEAARHAMAQREATQAERVRAA